ncbi:MAG: F0F1 ATP synthase subunit B [Oscillospiraceae bacterium]
MLESLNAETFIFAFLNLIILYVVLKKILFKPVTEFMENRTKSIQDSLDYAELQKKESLKMKEMYEKQLKEARAEGRKIVEECTVKAAKIYENLVDEAKAEAQSIMDNARAEIENEREQMLKGVRNQVVSIALSAATKVMQENMDSKSNQAMVEKFLDEAGVA